MQSTTGVARRETPQGTVELFYEVLGDAADPTVLLIMGLGAQLPMWPDGFCGLLVDAGYRVIRFDHRDSGLSAKLHGLKADGSVYKRVGRYLLGRSSPVPYTLIDMAQDVQALLDHLGIIQKREGLRGHIRGIATAARAGRHRSIKDSKKWIKIVADDLLRIAGP